MYVCMHVFMHVLNWLRVEFMIRPNWLRVDFMIPVSDTGAAGPQELTTAS